MKRINTEEFRQKLDEGAVKLLLDVRSPAEYGEQHVRGAVNCPLGELSQDKLKRVLPALEPRSELFVICRSGGRAAQACEKLASWGFDNLCLVEGGTTAAAQTGVPIEGHGRAVIGLERQVRIAAGTLVLLGTTAGLLLSPWWFAVPLFVGSGLIFAGVTDWCGMALILEKMPWNQVRS